MIKHSYKKLAMQYHPDRNKDPASAEHFAAISNAFSVLSDKSKRSHYDASLLPTRSASVPNLLPSKFDSMYDHFYPHKSQKTHSVFDDDNDESKAGDFIGDIAVDVNLSLEEIYRGIKKTYRITVLSDGQYVTRKCLLDLFPGIKDGRTITLEKVGNKPLNGVASDINFIVREKPHKFFTREGDNIVEHVELSLMEALKGFTHSRMGIDGELIEIEVKTPTRDGTSIKVPNRGMPKEGGGRGDAIFIFSVDFPEEITEEERLELMRMAR